MRLFHRTTAEAAAAILANGFIGDEGSDPTTDIYRGVWLCDVPLDIYEGTHGDTLLSVELDLSKQELRQYEWVEEDKEYREFLIPADVVNQHCKISIVNQDDTF